MTLTLGVVLVIIVTVIGGIGFLTNQLSWQEYLTGIGVAVGFGSGHGLSIERTDNGNHPTDAT